MKRSIILFPKFSNLQIIENIRAKYDPLATCIAPHITLVFPFESTISTEGLKAHFKEVLKGVKSFPIELREVTGAEKEGYLFLNVKKGNDEIIALHDKLYSGKLKDFLYRKISYFPHLTLGRLEVPEEFDKAIEELKELADSFDFIIEKVFVEIIDEQEQSNIEFFYDLE